jgi:ABC-type uncharacterized transport system permease subunit
MLAAILVLGGYLFSSWLLASGRGGRSSSAPLVPWLVALVVHGHLLVRDMMHGGGLDLGIGNMVSSIFWLIAVMLAALSRHAAARPLAIALLPLAGFTVWLVALLPPDPVRWGRLSWPITVHAMLSLLAYSFICMAVAHALMCYGQQRAIKRLGSMVPWLPPLETMDDFLVFLVISAFALLSAALLSGLLFVHDLFAQHLVQKTMFSLLAWCLLGFFLWGRMRYGWRGSVAVGYMLTSGTALAVAYFGSRLLYHGPAY